VSVTTLRFTVTDADTAIALGSGEVPVLATPRLVAWMEAVTVAAASVRLDATSTSVGTEVWLRHRRPSAVGAVVEVEVTSITEQDRGLSFEVVARAVPVRRDPEGPVGHGPDPDAAAGIEIASGRIVRAVVDRGAFLSRL
jgi:fluoroacetyl-CoA thioesterase